MIFRSPSGKFAAHANPALMGTDVRAPHFAITPPDDFAGSRRARADPAALRKSAPPQRAAPRYLR